MLSQQVHRGALLRRALTSLFFSGEGRSRMENVLGSQSCPAALLCEQVDLCPATLLCELADLCPAAPLCEQVDLCTDAPLCELVDLCPFAPLCEPVELFKFFHFRLLTNRGRMHITSKVATRTANSVSNDAKYQGWIRGITEIWCDQDYLGMLWRNTLFTNEGLHSNPALGTRPKSLFILSHLLSMVPKARVFSKESNLGGHWASCGGWASSLLLSAAQHFLYFRPRFHRW